MIRVKRDGPRGYRTIERAKYDANPGAFEVYEVPAEGLPPPPIPIPPPPASPVDPLAGLTSDGDWRTRPAMELRAIAAAASGRTPSNKAEAVALIEAELAKPAAPIPPPPVA